MIEPYSWTGSDSKAVDTARVLAMDAVERAGSGHAGTAMSLAPVAYLLFQKVMRHDPTDPRWLGRDRFVLSCGHTSLTLYIQLYFAGYGIELEDLKRLRTFGSLTPGHPEYGLTPGVETSTGPLGQGLGNAVGMAIASRRERGLFDPDPENGKSVFDHAIFVLVSDGDIDEGVTHEVSSLAGHQRLGNLVVVYDDNHISIEDDTLIARSEDVCMRYEAYGWHVQTVDWCEDGSYREDVDALYRALMTAKADDRPSFIALRTIIGWPSPGKQNTGGVHGAPLGPAEVAKTKELLGFDPAASFDVSADVLEHARSVVDRTKLVRSEWDDAYSEWRRENPDRASEFDRISSGTLPAGWRSVLPEFSPGRELATRTASGEVLNALAPVLPELWGGSADLASSTKTTMSGAPSFIPENRATSAFPGHLYGRTLHFGIREHGMGAILSGIALHGGTRPYGATFLAFSDYMRPAVRIAALMKLPVIYVWTHDSLGVGGDGPTHQPVEHLWALRAIPGLDVVRPADANETVAAWQAILEDGGRPTALCLTRQNVPVLDLKVEAEGVVKGGYILQEARQGRTPRLIIVATGSEVYIAKVAQEHLENQGIPTRLVSMPCLEWFNAQEPSYRESVLPSSVRARVSVEAGTRTGWREIVGDNGEFVSLEEFGASADPDILFGKFGFTPEAVVVAANATLRRVGGADE